MEDHRFDDLTRWLARPVSRRSLLKAAVASAIAGMVGKARVAEAAQLPCSQLAQPACCTYCNQLFPTNSTLALQCYTQWIAHKQGPCACGQTGGVACLTHPGTSTAFTCCAATQTCSNGTCCPTGTTNCGGTCVTCPTGGVCSGTSCACPSGKRNCSGTCQQCCTGADCSSGQICCNGTCSATCQTCPTDASCRNAFCPAGAGCSSCSCYTSVSGVTRCFSDCDGGTNCNTVNKWFCSVGQVCSSSTGPGSCTCTSDANCPSGTLCVSNYFGDNLNVCVPTC
jgi:hypothetical protein